MIAGAKYGRWAQPRTMSAAFCLLLAIMVVSEMRPDRRFESDAFGPALRACARAPHPERQCQ